MKLRTAIVFVKDMKKMTAFYRDGLGLRFLAERSSPGWAEFDAGGAHLALHAIPPEVAAGIEVSEPPAPRGETPIKLVFQADDVEAARTRLTSHGAVLGETRAWGACDGLDPEGNVFQLTSTAKATP